MRKDFDSGNLSAAAAIAAFVLGFWGAAAGDTVQVNIKSILNARSVSTYSNGKVYTWARGIDGNGYGDGYVTHSVAVFKNRTDVLTLPDSAWFPATGAHCGIVLNYSNSDSTGFQTHYLSGIDSVTFAVPQGKYSHMYLTLTSSEGASALSVTSTYTDGAVTSNYNEPDYAQGLSGGFFYVDSNLAKWSNQNVPVELTGHNVNGVDVHPDVARTLTSVKLKKNTAGSYVVFWGATGVGTLTTMVAPQRTVSRVQSSLRVVSCVNGLTYIANVKAGSVLTLFSPSGVKEAQVLCRTGGRVTVGGAGITVAPGVHVCELRCGQEVQRLQVLVP